MADLSFTFEPSDIVSKATVAQSTASDASSLASDAHSKAAYASSRIAESSATWAAGGGASNFSALDDTPADYSPGYVWTNAAETGLVISGNKNPDVVPSSPDADDDEFEGGGSIDGMWTIVNDPGMDQTTHEGFLYSGVLAEIAEVGAFDDFVRIHQTAPADETTWAYVIKAAMGQAGVGGSVGEWSGVHLYLGNSTDDEFVTAGTQYNDGWGARICSRVTGWEDNGSGVITYMGTYLEIGTEVTAFTYLKLEKTTANAYTSANTYNAYFSKNGIIWHQVGTDSKTFTTACDEIGIFFRKPKSQTNTATVFGIVDFFRKVA